MAMVAAAVSGVFFAFRGKDRQKPPSSTEPSIEGKAQNMGRTWQDMAHGRARHDSMAEGVHD